MELDKYIYLSICLSVCVYLSICLSVYLSTYYMHIVSLPAWAGVYRLRSSAFLGMRIQI
jgi:hypothetical protein